MILGRDLFILLGSILMIKKMNYVTPSNVAGKIAVFMITLLGLAYLLKMTDFISPIIALVIIMISISAFNYLQVFLREKELKNDE